MSYEALTSIPRDEQHFLWNQGEQATPGKATPLKNLEKELGDALAAGPGLAGSTFLCGGGDGTSDIILS